MNSVEREIVCKAIEKQLQSIDYYLLDCIDCTSCKYYTHTFHHPKCETCIKRVDVYVNFEEDTV